jgi:preprotein translocase subunit SecF
MATRSTPSVEKTPKPPRFFQVIPPDTHIDFVRLRALMVSLSLVAILVGFASIWARGGLNYGIDFAGGTMVQVKFYERTPIAQIRDSLREAALGEVIVQDVGRDSREFQLRVRALDDAEASSAANAIKAGLQKRFGEGTYDIERIETVGPKVGKNLWRDAMLAVAAATLAMGAYIAFRFDFRFGVGAAVALVHDVAITIGALSLANMDFDLTTVAGLLTVVGFSVNDTVIVSDRIRENMRKMRREPLANIVNLSINETLSRTLITSGTATLVCVCLFLLGGSVIHSFAFTMMVGFAVGTYSSIFVASPIVLYLEKDKGKRR